MIAITLTAIFVKKSNMQTYSYSYPITLGDIDTNYTLTINAILCYFQDTISRFLATGHVAPFDIKKTESNMDDYGVLCVVTRKKAALVRKHTCGGLDFGTFVNQGFCGFHNERRQKRGLCERHKHLVVG